jgi:hypothetical protein
MRGRKKVDEKKAAQHVLAWMGGYNRQCGTNSASGFQTNKKVPKQ